MHMGLGIVLEQRQELICSLCGRSFEEHNKDCPFLAAKNLFIESLRFSLKCNICAGTLWLNTDDFFECRACAAQFSAGEVGSDNKKIELLIDLDNDVVHHVHLLDEKGKGKFKIDRRNRVVSRAVEIAKKLVGRKRKNKFLTDFADVWLRADRMIPALNAPEYPPANSEELEKLTKLLQEADDSSFE